MTDHRRPSFHIDSASKQVESFEFQYREGLILLIFFKNIKSKLGDKKCLSWLEKLVKYSDAQKEGDFLTGLLQRKLVLPKSIVHFAIRYQKNDLLRGILGSNTKFFYLKLAAAI